MEHTAIIQKVREILNEQGGADGLIIGTDLVSLDDYIESAIPDAVVMLAQKGYRVNVCDFEKIDDGRIAVPENFISLLCLKLSTWNKAVNRIVEIGSPEYLMAMNEFTKPRLNSPVCYRENDTLVCLPIGEIGVGAYNGTYDTAEGLNAEPKEATAVCYMTAALVMGIYGDDNSKQRFSDLAVNMLQ